MFSTDEFSSLEPIPYLLSGLHESDIPLVYVNKQPVIDQELPLVWIVFGPGGVGKDTITKPLFDDGIVHKVQTATNRPRRVSEGEPEDYYLWMRQRHSEETQEDYVAHLVDEYKLLEYVEFNGFVYGTPFSNLEKTFAIGDPMLVITTQGVISLMKKLEGEANIITLFVVPENYTQLYERIQRRENPEQRLRISVGEVKIAPQLAHYYLFNPVEIDGKPALPLVQEALRTLVLTTR